MTTEKGSQKVKIGSALIEAGYLTQLQLEDILAHQKKASQYEPLGQLCVRRGFLSDNELSQVLKTYKYRLQFGDILVNMSLITPIQLNEALEKQKSSKMKIGELLIELGIITESQFVHCLSTQLGIPRIEPDIKLIDPNLALKVKETFLRRSEAIPAFRKNGIITIIMADPLSEEIIQDFSKLYRCQVAPVIGSRSAIKSLINKLFQKKSSPSNESEKNYVSDQQTENKPINPKDRKDNIQNIISHIISSAVKEGATNIHIQPQADSIYIRNRINGALSRKTDLPKKLMDQITAHIMTMGGIDELNKNREFNIQANISGKTLILKILIYSSINGDNIAIQILPEQTSIFDLEGIGFSPLHLAKYKQILKSSSGILLLSGFTGSGKTTTLYSSLQYLNKPDKVIITFEDKVKYPLKGIIQIQVDSRMDQYASLSGLISRDADVIMVDEINDSITAQAVVSSALSGHKVLSSFYAKDTILPLLRLMDLGGEAYLISSADVSVVAQGLIRTLCPKCKTPYHPPNELFTKFNIMDVDTEKHPFYQSVGCEFCNQTGFKGLTAIHEILEINDPVREAILSRKSGYKIRHLARQTTNFISLLEDGFYKAANGITSPEEVLRVVHHDKGDDWNPRTAAEVISLLDH